MTTPPHSTVCGNAAGQKYTCVISADIVNWSETGAVSELAIAGNGFFVVRNVKTNQTYATQVCQFNLDADGYMVTATGERLQGRTGAARSTVGDIQINVNKPRKNADGAAMVCYSIDSKGRISVHLSDSTSFVRAQILLQNFQDPEALVYEGDNLYSNLTAARPLPAPAVPGINGLGAIQWGVLELTNADSPIWNN